MRLDPVQREQLVRGTIICGAFLLIGLAFYFYIFYQPPPRIVTNTTPPTTLNCASVLVIDFPIVAVVVNGTNYPVSTYTTHSFSTVCVTTSDS